MVETTRKAQIDKHYHGILLKLQIKIYHPFAETITIFAIKKQ